MKVIKQLTLTLIILIFTVSSSFADKKEVTEKINQYLTAVQKKDAKTVENLVSDETNFTMINSIVEKTELLSEDDFAKFVKEGRAGAWVTSNKVMFVDQRDNLAIAYIESNGKTLIRKEYLTLVNKDGKWQITNSVSTLAKK